MRGWLRDRATALEAFTNSDASNPLYLGYNYMMQVADKIVEKEQLKSLIRRGDLAPEERPPRLIV